MRSLELSSLYILHQSVQIFFFLQKTKISTLMTQTWDAKQTSILIICASITHWLGSISKLPNQCENITKFSRHFQNCPINVRKLPNQCEMLAHPPCASISHWLGSFQKILGSFQVYQIYQNYPINVKCLHRGGAQAFHID